MLRVLDCLIVCNSSFLWYSSVQLFKRCGSQDACGQDAYSFTMTAMSVMPTRCDGGIELGALIVLVNVAVVSLCIKFDDESATQLFFVCAVLFSDYKESAIAALQMPLVNERAAHHESFVATKLVVVQYCVSCMYAHTVYSLFHENCNRSSHALPVCTYPCGLVIGTPSKAAVDSYGTAVCASEQQTAAQKTSPQCHSRLR
jgi:hypothetical protein